MAKKIVFEMPEYGIKVEQHGGSKRLFTVTYGRQVSTGLTYRTAATEFGLCAFHALGCAGKLNNNGI